MELEVIEDKENPLLERRQVRFKVSHPNAPTPPRSEVREELASTLDAPEDNIIIEKVTTLHGTQNASGIARVYKTKEQLEESEPIHLIERAKAPKPKPKEEAPEEAVKAPKEPEEEAEEEAEEEKEEEAPEEVEGEPEEEAGEAEEKAGEEEEREVESSEAKEKEEE